jgi:hypothetical protein
MEIAKTILDQMGGNRFAVMTGSKQFIALQNGIKMKLTRNKANAQYLTITLNAMDTYDMQFFSIDKNFNLKIKQNVEGIYNDQLQRIFTQVTGLYTRL